MTRKLCLDKLQSKGSCLDHGNRIKEFSHIDPNSMAFRYAEDKYSGSKKCSGVDDGIYVDVIHLQQAMAALYGTRCRGCGENLQRRWWA